ncbi:MULTISPECIES: chemotaxis protein CheW [Thioclava]|uniref:CheW-like domain-containing protein n=1 Tax=Thioclava nitratireducens TaxID=1915078 RepID=A0ABN4XE24_9RHOB|nr:MULTISPECIES: chemotaxis protein CheW [Thioclava]AQS48442.1 hypothetical protein BMG03_12025 [Thioclava nitratireducens]OWY04811.1 hypothetical protein B6V75_01295 [Thioclava sp. F1Mire-8]OWY06428.1 hypothetical protein B6V76_01095 [Thioclava sp. IC9]OWY08037.1 hypothetical protein B6V74_15840 [Thioclava sp. F42-5]OWY18657.1 hypothetical protein B6V73_02380 [Thioclava sp. JM3]
MTLNSDPRALDGDLVTFHLAGETLAVPTAQLREVLEPGAMTRVPGAPDFVAGLINVRGAVVPLADLRVPLRMPRATGGIAARVLVLDLDLEDQRSIVGILADSVHEVTRIPPESIERIPPVGSRWPPRYVAAVGRWSGRFVTIPDLSTIFGDFLIGRTAQPERPGATSAGSTPQPEHA